MRKNVNMLDRTESNSLLRSQYEEISFFQKKFNTEIIRLDIRPFYESFRSELRRLIKQKQILSNQPYELEELHHHLNQNDMAYNLNDGINNISAKFYDTDEDYLICYMDFVKDFIFQKAIKVPFYFQATPTIRMHFPHAINSHFYPRYHTDILYGHPPKEINIWLPLTKKGSGHGFKILSLENSRKVMELVDYDNQVFMDRILTDEEFATYCDNLAQPVNIEGGEVLLFDARCIHSAMPMKDHTRISMDIRVISVSDYNALPVEYQGKGRRKILFTPGNCYQPLPINEY